jgi:non-specific serine/threonine protein kinase
VADCGAGTRAAALALAAWTATMQDDPVAGRPLLDEASALLPGCTPHDPARAAVLLARAVEAAWRGAPEDALAPLDQAVTTARAADDRARESSALLLLGLCRAFTGDLDGADASLRACADLTGAAGEVHLRSYALAALAALAVLAGDPAAATVVGRQAVVMTTDLGDRSATAFVLEVLAWAAAAPVGPPAHCRELTATLLGAADAQWRRLGVDPESVPYLSSTRRRGEALAGIHRDAVAFRTGFQRGADLSGEDVLALALGRAPVEPAPEEQVPLTRREQEVAHLVGRGLANREIAEQLGISQRTVESHVDHTLRKLGFGSRTQVAAWVAEREARREMS